MKFILLASLICIFLGIFYISNRTSKYDLNKQIVFITGGTSGIGLATAKKFASLNCKVIICGRDKQKLNSIINNNQNISGFVVDLTSSNSVSTILDYFISKNINPSILINNAGVSRYMDFISEKFEDIEPYIEQEILLNTQSTILLSSALLPLISNNTHGAIINITSGVALAPKKTNPVYCATKAAVRAFTKALRYQIEDAKLNIRVLEVLPPTVDTAMTNGIAVEKISPEQVANDILNGLMKGKKEIYSGKTKWLKWIYYISPLLADKIMRNY